MDTPSTPSRHHTSAYVRTKCERYLPEAFMGSMLGAFAPTSTNSGRLPSGQIAEEPS